MNGPRLAILLAALLLATSACSHKEPHAVTAAPTATPTATTSPTPTAPPKPRKLNNKRLTKSITSYLRGRPLTIAVRDLTTGQSYRYRPSARFVTASVAKVDILMTLLLQAQKKKRKLNSYEKGLADQAIRYSDNKAADRLWERIGGAGPLASANRKLGLRSTRTIDGKCQDLYCWGITDTTAEEQVRLLASLLDEDGPLDAKNRAYVLNLMTRVVPEQKWGVSAAAGKGDQVALKNGWQRRLVHGKLWAINSVGRVRTEGHDLLIAVLSDHHATSAAGIAVVERVVELAAVEFRRTTPWLT